jgi:hypothetical protein
MRGDGVADGASHTADDIFGSAVATAAFQGASDSLVIESVGELRPEATAWPIFNIAASAILYPFRYSSGHLCVRRGAWPSGRLLVLSECGAGARREIWLTT